MHAIYFTCHEKLHITVPNIFVTEQQLFTLERKLLEFNNAKQNKVINKVSI